MRKLLGLSVIIGLCAGLSLSTTGCGKKEKKDEGKTKTAATTADKTTPSVTLVFADVETEPGKSADSKVTVTRVKHDDEVNLKFDAPEGIKVEGEKIAEKETKHTVTVTAKEDVKPGPYTVKVSGKSGKLDVSGTIKVMVKKKGEEAKKEAKISLKASVDPVEIKQGGKGKLKVTAKREHSDDDIALTFKDSKKGVDFKDATVKKGDKSVEVEVNVAKDAEVGDHEITVSGMSGEAKAEVTIKLKVTK